MTAAVSVQAEVEAHLSSIAALYRQVNGSRAHGAALGEQEMRVAVLYALTPMTAERIGRQLFLSEKTVKTVLRRIFTKLGITSRAELPAALANARGAS